MADIFERVRLSTSLPDLASSYGVKLKRNGAEFLACCPFHAEDTPSFSIFVGKDGFQRYRCFGCGAHGDVVDFVMTARNCTRKEALDILRGGEHSMPATRKEFAAAGHHDPYEGIEALACEQHPFVPGVTCIHRLYNPKSGKSMSITPTHVHEYRIPDGRLFGLVLRRTTTDPQTGKEGKETPTVMRVRLPDGKEVWSRFPFGRNRPLYKVETIGDAKTVLLVEGEKTVDALRPLVDIPVLTWAGGVKAIHYSNFGPLRDLDLIVWPDADEEGESAVRWIRSNFNSARVKVVR